MIKQLLGGSRQAFQNLMRVLYAIILIMVINTADTLLSSGFKGDVEVWTYGQDNRFRLIQISGQKTLPPNLSKNMLSVHFDHLLSRTIDYKRHVFTLGGFHVYAGGGVKQITYKGDMDTRYHLGVTVTF